MPLGQPWKKDGSDYSGRTGRADHVQKPEFHNKHEDALRFTCETPETTTFCNIRGPPDHHGLDHPNIQLGG